MGYRNLTTQNMVNISDAWLDPDQDRKVFTSLPLLGSLLPILEEAHEGLKTTQLVSSAAEQQLKALVQRAVALDALHDRKLRGAYNYLGALAEMTDDEALARATLDLRDRLVPAGLKAISRSYGDQAGDAKLLASRLDDASTKLLKRLKTSDGPLSLVVDAWVEAALALEKIDAQRAQLADKRPSETEGVTARSVINARNAWIRAVRAIETNLALEKTASDEMVQRLLGRLRKDEARADRRASRKGGAVDDADAPNADAPNADAPNADTPVAGSPGVGGAAPADDDADPDVTP